MKQALALGSAGLSSGHWLGHCNVLPKHEVFGSLQTMLSGGNCFPATLKGGGGAKAPLGAGGGGGAFPYRSPKLIEMHERNKIRRR